ncbi:hypothetical protein D3C73_1289350 [compost metagenome]
MHLLLQLQIYLGARRRNTVSPQPQLLLIFGLRQRIPDQGMVLRIKVNITDGVKRMLPVVFVELHIFKQAIMNRPKAGIVKQILILVSVEHLNGHSRSSFLSHRFR